MDQRRLVEQAREGDHDAFTELVGASAGRLDAIARLIVRDHELARDAVQDTLLRAWRDLPRLRDPDRFEAWLRRLLINACLDGLRHRRRQPIEVELLHGGPSAVPDDSGKVADRDALARAFARLDADHRAIVVCRYYLGASLPEAAAMLGIPLGTAKSRLSRSLAAMRVVVDDERSLAHPLRDGRPA